MAKHLGIPGVPPIRYEDMTSEIRQALVDIGTAQEEVTDDMGWIDYSVAATEKLESLSGIVEEFSTMTIGMTAKTQDFTGQLERGVENSRLSGGVQHIQNISRRFGGELSQYAGNVESLNHSFDDILPEIRLSFLRILTWEHLDVSQLSPEEVEAFLANLQDTEQAVQQWKISVNECCGIMGALPDFQRDMKRGAQRVLEQLKQLALRLDGTLDMISEVRELLWRRLGPGDVE